MGALTLLSHIPIFFLSFEVSRRLNNAEEGKGTCYFFLAWGHGSLKSDAGPRPTPPIGSVHSSRLCKSHASAAKRLNPVASCDCCRTFLFRCACPEYTFVVLRV